MVIKAKRLRPGDKIGVVSPASSTARKSDILRATEMLDKFGYQVAIGKYVDKQRGIVSATEEERVSDLHEMFLRDDINAVFVTQGGYGSIQLLDKIDYDLIRSHPKIFIGFSDITAILLAIYKLTGLITFHGPGMVRFNDEELSIYTYKQMKKAISSDAPVGTIPSPDPKKWLYTLGGAPVKASLWVEI